MPRKKGYKEEQMQLSLINGERVLDYQSVGLPNALWAERMVLASCLMRYQDNLPLAIGALSPESFTTEANRTIFSRMKEMYENGKRVDRVTVATELLTRKELDSVGGLTYLTSLDEGMPDIINLDAYVEQVVEHSRRRNLAQIGQAMINMSLMGEFDSDKIVGTITDRLTTQGTATNQVGGPDTVPEIVEEAGGIDKYFRTDLSGVSRSGWGELHRITGYFRPGELNLIAARPACGKTLVGLQMASYISNKLGIPTAFHTLEVDKRQLIQRLMAMYSSIDFETVSAGTSAWDDQVHRKIDVAFKRFEKAKLQIVEDQCYTVHQLRAWIYRQRVRPKVLFVDYLQLMGGSGKKDRREEVGAISRGLKMLAKTLGITIFAMVQLSRATEQADGGIPELHHMREAGDLEQDADKVLMLHRPELYAKREETKQAVRGLFDIYVRKNRQGKTGCARLLWEGQYCRVVSLSDTNKPSGVIPPNLPEPDWDEPPTQRPIDFDREEREEMEVAA